MKLLVSTLEVINSNYGTYRGLIRLLLARTDKLFGRLKKYQNIDLRRVNRVVFVCLGNVCRSPYAELIAHEKDLQTASCGLFTTSGLPAYIDAVKTANATQRDLTKHITTDISDFEIQDTDLLLVMEVRQLKQLERHLGNSKAQISLLGLWSNPSRPHIHDPMTLSDTYFLNCYLIIENAVSNFAKDYFVTKNNKNLHG